MKFSHLLSTVVLSLFCTTAVSQEFYADRCAERTATTGTGTYSLTGAVTGYRTFVAGVGDGNTCPYCVYMGANWEVGIGTLTDASPDTLTRDTILASSNSGAAVDWGGGTKTIFLTYPAAMGLGTYVTISASNVLPYERVLVGTANKVSVTDGGAGGNVTLSLPSTVNLEVATAGDGGTTNYTSVEADGTVEFQGAATVWDDLRIPITSAKGGGVRDPDFIQFKDDGSSSTGVYTYAFDSSADEELFFTVQMPHGWKTGSNITPHVHWAPSNANAGGITWGLEYTWASINATYGDTTLITTDDATDSTSHKHHIVSFAAIDATGKTLSSMLICRLYRDVSDDNDTYASDAFLLEIDFHYEIDTVGSRDITSK